MSFLPQLSTRPLPLAAGFPETARLSREGEAPLYEQVRQALVALISSQAIAPGHILPSEHELCRSLGVSRTVVRQALGQLENQGIVDRVRGKGTFVAHPKVAESLLRTLVGLYEDATERGGIVRSEVLDHGTIPAVGEVAGALQVTPGTPVVRLERVRIVDDEPWSRSIVWMPAEVGEHTYSADMRTDSLYQVLRRHGIVGMTGTRSVEAVVATSETARLLHIPRGSALLKLRSIRKDPEGKAIEYFVAFHRGDRSRFEFELAPDNTKARIVSHEGSD